MQLLISFVSISIILSIAILIYFKIAGIYGIIDKPNNRSSHSHITIRGGGIIFYISTLLYALVFGLTYRYFIIGISIISIISFLDDIFNISSKIRIFIHLCAVMLMFYDCGFYDFEWYYFIIALIISIGIINAFNFMDGINGITGGYSLIVILSFLFINNKIEYFIDNNLIYVTLIAILIFNLFNFKKNAKCFAGDIGAISIAFIIIFLLGKLIIITGDFSYLIILMLYGVDSTFTIAHRIFLKENIFMAHRKHLYQIMSNELNMPHTTVSLIYMIIQLAIMVGYFYFNNHTWTYFIVTGIILGLSYVIFMKRYFILHKSN